MSDFREEEALGKAYDARLARRLFGYLRPYRKGVTLAALLTLAVAPLLAAGPKLFQVAVDRYIVPAVHGQLPAGDAVRGLAWVAGLFLATLALGFAVQYAQVRVMQKVGQQTMYDLRKEIFERLQRLPISFYDRSPVGRLVTRVTTDVDALNDLFATGITAMVNDAFLLLVFVGIMLWMHWKLALATFAVLPFIVLITWIFRNRVRDANRRIRTAIARINSFLQEHLSGMSVVQLFNHERQSREEFARLNRQHMEAYKDAILAFALFFPGVEFLSVVAIITVFWYGGMQALTGAVPVGVLLAFMLYAQRFFQPIQDLSEKFNILQAAMAASERIFRLLDEPVPADSAGRALPAPPGRNRVPQRLVRLPRRGHPPRGRLGAARRLVPRRTGTDRGHRGPHRRRQDHDDPVAAALL